MDFFKRKNAQKKWHCKARMVNPHKTKIIIVAIARPKRKHVRARSKEEKTRVFERVRYRWELRSQRALRLGAKRAKKISAAILTTVLLLAIAGTSYALLMRNRTTHYVVLTFDCGGQAEPGDQSVAIMNQFGYKGVIFNPVTTYSYQNITIYKDLVAAGWEIGDHTWDHPASMRQLNATELDLEIVQSKTWLESTFNVSVISFAYPNSIGETNQTVNQALTNAGFLYARGDDWDEASNTYLPAWTGNHIMEVESYPVTLNETGQGYVVMMNDVIHDSLTYGVSVAMFHDVDTVLSNWGAVTPTEFQWCLQQIKNAGLQVVTFEGWDQIK